MTETTGHETSAIGFSAVCKQQDGWWIGWIAEVPGINGQEVTQAALLDSLRQALRDAIAMNRQDARAAAGDGCAEIAIVP